MENTNKFLLFNKPHSPSVEAQKFIYEIYSLLFRADGISQRVKQTTLETAAVNLYPWKIVCISEKALRHILKTDSAVGLRRGHPLKRADRAIKLFSGKTPMSIRKFIAYYFENDTVALVDRRENGKNGTNHWSQLFDVPEGRLTKGSFAVRLSRGDLDWVRTVCKLNHISVDTV